MKTQEIIILIVLIFFILFFINNNRQENYNRTENVHPALALVNPALAPDHPALAPNNWQRNRCGQICSSFPDISVDCNDRIYPNICIANCMGENTSTCRPINQGVPVNPGVPVNWQRDRCDRLCSSVPGRNVPVDCNNRIYANICMANCMGENTSTCRAINKGLPVNPGVPVNPSYGSYTNAEQEVNSN
jgi:hypothetical protein